MKCIHIISGSVLSKVLKKVTSKFECNYVLCIGETDEEISYIKIKKLFWNESTNSDLLTQVISVLDQIEINKSTENYYVCLNSPSLKESVQLFLISLALGANIYSLDEEEFILPQIALRRPDEQEQAFLAALISLNGSSDSFGKIASLCGWGEENDAKGVARASYVANKLGKEFFIKKERIKRSVGVELTEKGKTFYYLTKYNK